uniref:Uncharacterized protein n=1 Tax=Brassica oleracea var. oleracea TaxID=109376 RepID=A0A0D3EG43_BRAOL
MIDGKAEDHVPDEDKRWCLFLVHSRVLSLCVALYLNQVTGYVFLSCFPIFMCTKSRESVDEEDTYDYLPGKRYFICKDFENDGMHFRQPWVMGVQQEVERLKIRVHEHEKLLRECDELKAQVRMLLRRVLYFPSAFEEGDSSRSSQVDMSYSTDMPSNLGNMLGVRNHVRDRRIHEQLKNDLIDNIWNKFGNDEDV